MGSLKGGGGSSRNQTTTSTTEPPKYLRPFLEQGMQGAQGIYNQGPQQYYPGQTVVGFSPETEQALGMQASRAQSGSPLMGQANTYASGLLGGKNPITFGGASNPYLDAQFQHAADITGGRLQTEFGGSGRNLDAMRPARAEELNNLATSMYGGAYESERDRMASEIGQQRAQQFGVLGLAPGMAQADYADIDRLRDVGATREDLTGREMQDAAARFDFNQNAPGANLDQYLARLGGYPGSAMSTQTPIYRNQMAGALGGAGAGYQIGSQFGGNGGLWGAGIGGLLGYLG
jgi:hypothetical protein